MSFDPAHAGVNAIEEALTKHRQEKAMIEKRAANDQQRLRELDAIIEALNALKRPCEVIVHTDSQYVQKGISQWIHDWKRRGWRTADKKPVKNVDLWQRLDAVAARHSVKWHWVKGHAGDPGNERADALANRGAAENMSVL